MDEIFDLIVIGLGSGGLRAAKKAALSGLSVLAFERGDIGGCCLNRGCIPTKTILHSSEVYASALNLQKEGVKLNAPLEISPDIQAICARKNKITGAFSKAAEKDLISKGVKIIKEEARADFSNLTVNGYKARNIILATGSIPFELRDLPFNGENILSSDDLLNLQTLPDSVVIIGSGAIGIEWARIFSNFGVETAIVEKAPVLAPLTDISIQKKLLSFFRSKKIKTYTGRTAKSFKNGVLKLDTDEEINADAVVVAIGRKRVLPGGLEINSDLSTNFENVYAIGDIAANKMLAHTANSHADYVIDKINGKNPILMPDIEIPSVIYGAPEIASIGLREQDLDPMSDCKILQIPLRFLPKSWCDNQTEGFIKLITKNGQIKGAHIVSPEASSLITQIQIMMKTGFLVSDIEKIVFAHPTYSEGIYETIVNG